MKPTFEKRFCSPDISARDVVVLPTCCLVAATNMGRDFLVLLPMLVDFVLSPRIDSGEQDLIGL